ncbi:hypothetical protein GCM10022227_19190 [Streptomyces sedi]
MWSEGWPEWPQTGPDTERRLRETLHGGRWAISGEWTGQRPQEARLADRFARFVGARWCVPVDHGTSALLIALQTAGVRPGDEVIVPGLTWVACASVVARAGAVPVLADVDPRTLCVDPAAVDAAVTPRTAAILAVHLYSAMAEMDALQAIAERHGLALIEDAAQAYGATWRGQGAGTLGLSGAFSAQQGKALTSGEGGLFVTSSREVRDRAEMLRGDGRRYGPGPHTRGQPDMEEADVVQGWNMHLTEFQSTLLLDGLERLDEQNRTRARAAKTLDERLTEQDDLEPIEPYAANDTRAYYHYAIRLKKDGFGGRGAEAVAEALSAELGRWIRPPYRPLNEHPLYDPRRLPSGTVPEAATRLDPTRFELPVARRESARTVLLHHSMLLGNQRHLDAVVEAFAKVRHLAAQLAPVGDS